VVGCLGNCSSELRTADSGLGIESISARVSKKTRKEREAAGGGVIERETCRRG
jgi:hypothetical protein